MNLCRNGLKDRIKKIVTGTLLIALLVSFLGCISQPRFTIDDSWDKEGINFCSNCIENDGKDWTKLSVTIRNNTNSKIVLKSLSIVPQPDAPLITLELQKGGSYTIGPGKAGEQTWVYKVYSNGEVPGTYEIHVYIDGELHSTSIGLTVEEATE